ncbi:MAG TPA: hypothetical protein VFS00_18555 [Polyangiaceae bacterium]|nr:hypothetical protein [Polyangiaceae bacterium]
MPKLGGAFFGPALALVGASLVSACGEPKTAANVHVGSSKIVGNTNYWLSLNDSPDIKKKLDEGCAEKAAGDEKAKNDCVAGAMSIAGNEGMRFEKAPGAKQWTYLYFRKVEDGTELVYNRLGFNIVRGDDPAKLTIRPTGQDTGTRPKQNLSSEIVFDMPDEATIILFDPNGSRTVFKKK